MLRPWPCPLKWPLPWRVAPLLAPTASLLELLQLQLRDWNLLLQLQVVPLKLAAAVQVQLNLQLHVPPLQFAALLLTQAALLLCLLQLQVSLSQVASQVAPHGLLQAQELAEVQVQVRLQLQVRLLHAASL